MDLSSFNKFLSFHIKALQEKAISFILNKNNQIEQSIIKIKDLSNIYFYNTTSTPIPYQNINDINEIKTQELNNNGKKILKLILYNNQFINRIQKRRNK